MSASGRFCVPLCSLQQTGEERPKPGSHRKESDSDLGCSCSCIRMRALRPLLETLQSSNQACNQPSLISAWLQHLLCRSSCSMHTSSSLQQQQQGPAGAQRQQHAADQQEASQAPSEAHMSQPDVDLFSIRPSALSPLHPYHRSAFHRHLKGLFLQAQL